MKVVIGLSGRIGAGKGTVADYLAENYGAQGCRFSDILVDLLKRLHIPAERKALQKMGSTLRSIFGDEVLINALKKDLEEACSEMLMVDGVRYPNEIDMLKSFDKSILFFVEAPPEIRFERVKKRAEKGEDKIDFKEFLKAERRETERYLDVIEKNADHVLDNSGSFEDLYRQVEAALKESGL